LGYNIKPVIIEQEDETVKTYIIAGKKWDEIPEEVKTEFKSNKIQMVFFKGMSFEERERQFIKLQGGKKLSNAEINKVKIGNGIREFIYRQLATDLWTKHVAVTSNREVKFETMQQVLMVISGTYDLSGKSLQAFSEDSEIITDGELIEIELTTGYLNEVVKQIKKLSLPIELQSLEESEAMTQLEPKQLKKYLKTIEYLKKVNVPIIYNSALKAMQNDVSAKDFAKFVSKFFSNVSAKYKRLTEDGSSSAVNVKGRVETLNNALVSEFKIIDKIVDMQVVETMEETVGEIQSEEWEQPQQLQILDTSITNVHESIGENIQLEQTETLDVNQEDIKAILNIVNNVA